MTIQCAWCNLVQDASGQYAINPGRKLRGGTAEFPEVSHGICPKCGAQFLSQIAAMRTSQRQLVTA